MRISDWSSDVCSSYLCTQLFERRISRAKIIKADLDPLIAQIFNHRTDQSDVFDHAGFGDLDFEPLGREIVHHQQFEDLLGKPGIAQQIGSASCREKVCQSV